MTHTPMQQFRDQALHLLAGLVPVLFFLLLPTVAAFALLGLYMGLIREVSQHDDFNLAHLSRNSWLDVIFWTLGGLAAGLLV